MGKRKIKKRFFVFIGLLAAVSATVLFMAMGGGSENIIENGVIVYEKTEDVALLRDEKVVLADNYAKVMFFSLEGAYVETDTKIMEIYKWGYNDAFLNDLMNKQLEILNCQEAILQDVIQEDLIQLNNNIRQKMSDISDLLQGRTKGDLLTLENELKEAMELRRVHLKDTTKPTQELSQLYEKEQALIDKIDMYKLDVLAEAPGIVSFYFDGNEALLTPALLDDLTQESIAKVVKGVAPKQTESRVEKPIYRLINNSRWFCLLPRGKDMDKVPLTDKGPYDIIFDGFHNALYSGTLEKINKSETGTVYVFEMKGDVSPLINIRRIKATFRRTFEGLKVPLKALAKVQDEDGIYVQNGQEKTFVSVIILTQDDKSAIIKPKDQSVSLQAGQHFIKP